MHMAKEVGSPDKAAEYVKKKRANKEPVMGFGHRVYRAEDPRARHMRAGVEKLSREMGQPQWYLILEALVGLGVGKIVAQAVAIILVTPLNFVGNKLWSFRRR